MVTKHLPPPAPEEDTALVRTLADFAAWLTVSHHYDADMEHYSQLARAFLTQRRTIAIVSPPQPEVAWCDLCGQQFERRPTYKLEALTGDNYLWCPPCLKSQQECFRLLGPTAYRAAWKRQQQNGVSHA